MSAEGGYVSLCTGASGVQLDARAKPAAGAVGQGQAAAEGQAQLLRYLGLAFAFSHAVHALLILAYWKLFPETFWSGRSVAANIPGSIGYLFILLLTLTSFRTPARLLGPRAWKALHSTGTWVLAGIFCLSFFKRIPMGGWYVLAFATIFSAIVLKLTAKLAVRLRRRDVQPA